MSHLLDELVSRYPILAANKQEIEAAFLLLQDCYKEGNKLLVCGNGGSDSDAQHIVGELMKSFKRPRKIDSDFAAKLEEIDSEKGAILAKSLQKGLPAIALGAHTGLNTAFINDVENGDKSFFAQQVLAYGKPGDVFLGISTSGNSKDVVYAAITAKAMGLKVIGLTSKGSNAFRPLCDVAIAPNEKETYKIQELHLPIYHCLCLMLEEAFFG